MSFGSSDYRLATAAGSALRIRAFTISTLAPTDTESKSRTTSRERIRMQP